MAYRYINIANLFQTIIAHCPDALAQNLVKSDIAVKDQTLWLVPHFETVYKVDWFPNSKLLPKYH